MRYLSPLVQPQPKGAPCFESESLGRFEHPPELTKIERKHTQEKRFQKIATLIAKNRTTVEDGSNGE
jgi:hypothetical protein